MSACLTALALGVGRIIRRWNQTGQKQAGSPDIVKTFLSPSHLLLWSLVILAYLYFGANLTRGRGSNLPPLFWALSVTGVSAALSFKIAFTRADAPELLANVPLPTWALDVICMPPLIHQAQLVFASLLGITAYNFSQRTALTTLKGQSQLGLQASYP